ncbi:MAG: SpoIIE family protein phosphatase [Leptospiraceae bacterium]|nr:SpoIIE family protein phosphatase [Leptospiraceae bacterium]MCP5512301.1 SpoIIE family protein phosphatase [Leptospiraceae bacterium]
MQWEYSIGKEEETIIESLQKDYIRLPRESNSDLARLHPNNKGILWLRTKFILPEKEEGVLRSFSTSKVYWAEETYLNGMKLYSFLDKDHDHWNYWNSNRIFPLPEQIIRSDEETVLLLKIYIDTEGQVPDTLLIGETRDMEYYIFLQNLQDQYLSVVMAFLFILISGYHLLIYLKRKKDKENLFYAMFAFFYSLYSTNFFSPIIHFLFPGIEYFYFQKIVFASLYISNYSVYRFSSIIVGRNESKNEKNFFIVLLVIALTILLALPSYEIMYMTRSIRTIFYLPYLLAVLGFILKGAYQGNREARTLSIGVILVLSAVIFDTLNFLNNWGYLYTVSIVIPIYLAGIMFVLANKFVTVHNQTDELNENLESKVAERTAEVQKSMNEIKSLNEQQEGDYFLTSLIIKPLGRNFNKSNKILTEFYLEQKKHFQFRGRNSDLGGDICISGNLRFYDKDDRYIFFFNGDAMGKSMQGAGGAIVAGAIVNYILANSARDDRVLQIDPDIWMKNTFLEIDNVFRTFDGSMLISAAVGLVRERTGEMFYFNCEHPKTVLFRNGKAIFLEEDPDMRKLGTMLEEQDIIIQKFQLKTGDILFCGSDGRDDLELGNMYGRIINENEKLILKLIERSNGDLNQLIHEIKNSGKLTDDISILKVSCINIIDSSDSVSILNPFGQLRQEGDVFFSNRQYDQALNCYQNMMQNNPDDSELNLKIGICFKHLGKFEEAKDSLEKVVSSEESNLTLLIHLSDLYRLLNEKEKARNTLNRALDLIPYYKPATRLDQLLN